MRKSGLLAILTLAGGLLVQTAWPASGQGEVKEFDGHVELHTKHVAEGEDLVQIIDRGRSIICYGKMSTGGAATISCQKYTEEAPSGKKKER